MSKPIGMVGDWRRFPFMVGIMLFLVSLPSIFSTHGNLLKGILVAAIGLGLIVWSQYFAKPPK